MNACVLTLISTLRDLNTEHIWRATSLVGAKTRTCKALLLLIRICSRAITAKTHVFPVPDLAWTMRSLHDFEILCLRL